MYEDTLSPARRRNHPTRNADHTKTPDAPPPLSKSFVLPGGAPHVDGNAPHGVYKKAGRLPGGHSLAGIEVAGKYAILEGLKSGGVHL